MHRQPDAIPRLQIGAQAGGYLITPDRQLLIAGVLLAEAQRTLIGVSLRHGGKTGRNAAIGQRQLGATAQLPDLCLLALAQIPQLADAQLRSCGRRLHQGIEHVEEACHGLFAEQRAVILDAPGYAAIGSLIEDTGQIALGGQ